MNKTLYGAAFALAMTGWASGPDSPPPRVPARIVVTIGHSYGRANSTLTPGDLTVSRNGYDPLPVTRITSLKGTPLELYILVDHCSNCEPGAKVDELRRFAVAQPANTAVGVAYIRDGKLEIAQTPTADRALPAQALNAPAGGKLANPFVALADLIEGWKVDPGVRQAVLLITTGADPDNKDMLLDKRAETAIAAAQRAGVIVYGVYHPMEDSAAVSYAKLYSGQLQLSHVATETGGEAYFLNFGPLPSLAPFLTDISDHLASQFAIEFTTDAPVSHGELREFVVKGKTADLELIAPARAPVTARVR